MSHLCEWQTLFESCHDDAVMEVDFRSWGIRRYCDQHFCDMQINEKSKWVKGVRPC